MAEKTQPSDRVLVSKAIRQLKERDGSTIASIKKYLVENHSDRDIADPKNLKQYLSQAVDRGVLLRLDGGRYKVKETARRKSRSKSKSGSKRRSKSRKSRSKSSKRSSGSRKTSKSRKRSKSKKSAEPADSSDIQAGNQGKSSKDRKPVAEGSVHT